MTLVNTFQRKLKYNNLHTQNEFEHALCLMVVIFAGLCLPIQESRHLLVHLRHLKRILVLTALMHMFVMYCFRWRNHVYVTQATIMDGWFNLNGYVSTLLLMVSRICCIKKT